MKQKLIFLLLLFISSLNSNAQSDFKRFIPENYKIFETYKGDLNNDAIEDVVLIIKEVNTKNIIINRFDKTVDRNRRGIIILFKTKQGYKLANENYTCFSSENEDGGNYYAPVLSVEIEHGNLNVYYEHGRYGSWNYTFKFLNSQISLIQYTCRSTIGPIVREITTINFLTKKKLIATNINAYGEANEDEIFENNWSIIKNEDLIQLNKIKDFEVLEINKL